MYRREESLRRDLSGRYFEEEEEEEEENEGMSPLVEKGEGMALVPL